MANTIVAEESLSDTQQQLFILIARSAKREYCKAGSHERSC